MKATSFLTWIGIIGIALASCKKKTTDPTTSVNNSGTSQLATFFDGNVTDKTQHFTMDASTGGIIHGSQGTTVMIYGNTLKDASGNLVSGNVTIDLLEIYNRADMVLLNKPTMGILPNGDKSALVSKGEYYLKITANGTAVNANNGVYVFVPVDNIAGTAAGMSLFDGTFTDGNLAWNLVEDSVDIVQDSVGGQMGSYYQILENQWGWTNVDRFYNDPRPKTSLKVKLPTGFDNTNSEVYLSYDGEPGTLAALDVFTTDGYFSEHYGQIPIGLDVHFIAVTMINGQLNYAIQGTTITNGHIENINAFTPITQTDLANLINALP